MFIGIERVGDGFYLAATVGVLFSEMLAASKSWQQYVMCINYHETEYFAMVTYPRPIFF